MASAPVKNMMATLIAGPTASGKSDFALQRAKTTDAIIINADSMQIYDGLMVLSARPNMQDMQNVPHHLYGYVAPKQAYSTGRWLLDVKMLLDKEVGRPMIFVGGTGLYFKALLEGLSEIPTTPEPIRAFWRNAYNEKGAPALFEILQQRDPLMAAKLSPTDGQRIIRALEVQEATGQSLALWQAKNAPALLDAEKCEKIVLLPPRELLYHRINQRFDQMVEKGALDEVKALRVQNLGHDLPAMKAIGVPEFSAYLDGDMPLEEAIEKAKMRTRNYAKRQMTWFRNQFSQDWKIITPPYGL